MKNELKVMKTVDGLFIEARGKTGCEQAAILASRLFGVEGENEDSSQYQGEDGDWGDEDEERRTRRGGFGLLLGDTFVEFHTDGSRRITRPWPPRHCISIQQMLDRGDHQDAAEAAAEAILDGLLDTFGTEYSPLAQVALADALKNRLGDTIPAGGSFSWSIAGPSPEMAARMRQGMKARRSGEATWDDLTELADDDAQGVAAPSDSERPEPNGAAPEEEGGDCPEGEKGGNYPGGVTDMK